MKRLLLLILFSWTPLWGQTHSIEELSWMSGHWTSQHQEEQWSAAKAKTLLGYHRDFQDGTTKFFEFLRIEEDDDGRITYWASPAGKSWTPFRLTSARKNAVVFSNPEHDYPKEIRYQRQGKVMSVEISDGGAKKSKWKWRLTKP